MTIQKNSKIEGRNRDYLQDLYGTPKLTTTEYNQNYNTIKTARILNGILNKKRKNKKEKNSFLS